MTKMTTDEILGTNSKFNFESKHLNKSPKMMMDVKQNNPYSSPVCTSDKDISMGVNVPIVLTPTIFLKTTTIRMDRGNIVNHLSVVCSDIGKEYIEKSKIPLFLSSAEKLYQRNLP